jgi:RecB family nuclease, putative, TM0106 family
VITLGRVTTTDAQPAASAGSRAREVVLDAAALTRCRRRIHLDHDPSAADSPQAPPDPAAEQRKADAAAHRARIGAELAGLPGWVTVPPGPHAERVAATAAAVAAEAAYIWNAALPTAGGRSGGAELLVRLPEGGYVPVIVVRHRISDPGEGAVTSPLLQPSPLAAAPDPRRRVRSQPRDLMRLAHLHELLAEQGWGAQPQPGALTGGVIGMDADVVVWHDLTAGLWPADGEGVRSTLEEYRVRFADRIAVAEAARTGAPPLALPSRITECRRCPWWPRCEAELVAADDVSLIARGEVATMLRGIDVTTVADLAALDPAQPVPIPLPEPVFADLVGLARARRSGLSVVRRVPRVEVPRADVEIDVDMESFGESGAYLWGTLLTLPGGVRPGDEAPGYRAFVTWDPLPTPDEARSFAEFWQWFTGVRAHAEATGRTFAAYCYNEQAENRWLLDSARRFAGRPGIPSVAEVEAFIADPCWVDMYAVVDEWFLCAQGKGLKRIAPVAGFSWHDPEAGGENSMRWYRAAVGMDGEPPDLEQRRRLLTYNSDDVAATHALRTWMTSPAVEEVPLAADL